MTERLDWRAFSRLWDRQPPSQQKYEFFSYLQFVETHFQMKGIEKPIVVEIGVKNICQAAYYERFLNAEYIGIDVSTKDCDQIIHGNSLHLGTQLKLKQRLDGRLINLLFIDGDHRYGAVKADWNIYSPLVKNLVALHDINASWETMMDESREKIPSVKKLWNELYLENRSMVSFKCPGTCFVIQGQDYAEKYYESPGIGVVILDRDVIENRWILAKKDFETKYGERGELFPLAPFHYNGGLKQ